MVDPLTLAIAAAAAGKAVELTGQPARDGIIAFSNKVRARLRKRPDDVEALDKAITTPDDNTNVVQLAEVLHRTMEEDAVFAGELEAALQHAMRDDSDFRAEIYTRLRRAQVESTAGHQNVTLVFNGTAEKYTQIGNMYGGNLTVN
ncbi:hypothetical protein [Actinomadura fibrosa]|uniref:Uncharacterized protein n=1 Tax=Actinomadura fibrosa TaxID=111802 RepID=A0ABW2XNT8_9ACTN|nr:hypothetical protein [Actinomadura fibrosa]